MKFTPNHAVSDCRSLFIVSLPRSLSTLLYHAIRGALKFNEPSWTTDGEILNVDRFAFLAAKPSDLGRKFTTERDYPGAFQAMSCFLDDMVKPTDNACKDVIQPFVITRWLQGRSFATLRIKRSILDIAYSMVARGWYYPKAVVPEITDRELGLLKGLKLAEKTIDCVEGAHVDFDELIYDEEVVRRALAAFYPDLRPRSIRYIDEDFKRLRADVLARRTTKWYKSLRKMLSD